MGAQQQQTDRLTGGLGKHIADGEEVAQALGHLLAVHLQHAIVDPEPGETAAGKGAQALRHLVFMVRENQVAAAAMDVEGLAKEFPRHRGALDMPARPASAPRTVPSRQIVA